MFLFWAQNWVKVPSLKLPGVCDGEMDASPERNRSVCYEFGCFTKSYGRKTPHNQFYIFSWYFLSYWAWRVVVVKALRYKSDGPGIDSRWCHWIFHWHISFRPYHGPRVDSVPSENEYQEHFLEVKVAGAWGWQPYHLHVPIVLKYWSLNHLEPSGTVQGCNGIAIRLPFTSSVIGSSIFPSILLSAMSFT